MEKLVLIQEAGVYSEHQYNKQDGSQEYFRSRGLVMKHGSDTFYAEMTGDYASKNRDTQYDPNTPYVVRGSWKHRTWQDQQGKLRHENTFFITDIQAL